MSVSKGYCNKLNVIKHYTRNSINQSRRNYLGIYVSNTNGANLDITDLVSDTVNAKVRKKNIFKSELNQARSSERDQMFKFSEKLNYCHRYPRLV